MVINISLLNIRLDQNKVIYNYIYHSYKLTGNAIFIYQHLVFENFTQFKMACTLTV